MSAERGASIRALERGIEVLRLLGPQEGSSLRALHAASALPKPTLKLPTGTLISPMRSPMIIPTESVSRSVAVLGRAILPASPASLLTALLRPATKRTSKR